MARHVVLLEAFHKSFPQKPRSSQSNESTVSSSCTSLEFTICLVLMKIQRCRRCGNSAESQQLERAREHLNSAHKHHGESIVERHLEDEQHQMRMHEQGYTSPTWKNVDRMASEHSNYVATPAQRAHHRDQYKIVQHKTRRRQQHREDRRTP